VRLVKARAGEASIRFLILESVSGLLERLVGGIGYSEIIPIVFSHVSTN
jgi:hypothetical protein